MRAVDIIIKKREKQDLTAQEIDFFVQGFTNGEIPDYQASAFAMAVLLNGMTPFETADLTLAMARSGQVLDLSKVVDIAVDKHSSGGVGDKTSISVMPMVAACGLPVGKMSGRGLVSAEARSTSSSRSPGIGWISPPKNSNNSLKKRVLCLPGNRSILRLQTARCMPCAM